MRPRAAVLSVLWVAACFTRQAAGVGFDVGCTEFDVAQCVSDFEACQFSPILTDVRVLTQLSFQDALELQDSAFCLCYTNQFMCFNDCNAVPANFISLCLADGCTRDQCEIVSGAAAVAIPLATAVLTIAATVGIAWMSPL